jgi:hydroxymethylglutaryl-CoA lyase
LQNEKQTIPLATKIELVERLAKTGLTTIEAGSFVSPKWVPQVRENVIRVPVSLLTRKTDGQLG